MKIAYSLLMLLFSVSAFAQRSADIELLPPLVGTTEANQHLLAPYEKIWIDPQGYSKYYITFRIKNHGPDSLLPYDMVVYESSVTTIKFSLGLADAVPKDSVYHIIIKNGNPPVQIPVVLDNMPFPFQAYTDTVGWCDTAWLMSNPINSPVSDPDATNNKICQQITANVWTGIRSPDNHDPSASWYPNPATDGLTVKLSPGKSTDKITIQLRNLVGKEVYSYTTTGVQGTATHNINIAQLPAGIYITEVTFGETRILDKITIQ